MNTHPGPGAATAPRNRGPLLPWLLGWLVITLCVLGFKARPAHTPVDVDEFYWIGSTYYYHLAFENGAWAHPDWSLLPARENPPVAKYMLGLGLQLGGQPIATPDLLGTFYLIFQNVPHAWGEGPAYAKRAAVVERMRPDLRQRLSGGAQLQLDQRLLLAGRRTVLAVMIATSLLVFLLGARLIHAAAGLGASALFGIHPAVVHSFNLAHSDIIALGFSTAAAWITYVLVQRIAEPGPGTLRRLLPPALGAGAGVALACGAKMNALVVAALAGAAVLLALFRRARRQGALGLPVAAALAAGATALAVFILINPAITNDLAGGLSAVVREHRATELIQARFMRDHLTALPAKFAAVGELTVGSSLGLAAAALGSALLIGRSRVDSLRFLALWFLLALVAVTLWIPFPLTRYVLPVVLPGTLLAGALAAVGALKLWRRLRPSAGSP